MVDFNPTFFSRNSGSSGGVASGAGGISVPSSSNSASSSRKYTPSGQPSAMDQQRAMWRNDSVNSRNQFRDNMPVANLGVPGSAATVSDISFANKEMIMSDGSRVKFGSKLSGREIGANVSRNAAPQFVPRRFGGK